MVNDQDHLITTGPKDSDEMCIFYVMYYVETEKEPELSQVDNCSLLKNIYQQFSLYVHLEIRNLVMDSQSYWTILCNKAILKG